MNNYNPHNLKIGDLITPLSNRKTSNDFILSKLKKCKIKTIKEDSWSRKFRAECIIKEGYSQQGGSYYRDKGESITIYLDAFKRAYDGECDENYEIC